MYIHSSYHTIISVENLFCAWGEFRKGKRKRKDVQVFERNLEDNLFSLRAELESKKYRHACYESFYVYDPKQRLIHKAVVKDRVVHHLLYKFLYQIFNPTFIYDSYSCRLGKGTHKGVDRLENFTRKVSKNYTKSCWALKCDIKKFFDSVDQEILLMLLAKRVLDKDILRLLFEVIYSFHSKQGVVKGIPLGNLTSQIFANIYLNELDQFAKHTLHAKYYLRYCDDFLILDNNKVALEEYVPKIAEFLKANLKLELHSKKVILRKLTWGIDFLGYVVLPHYRLSRTKTRRRIFQKIQEKVNSPSFEQSFQSYLGYLSHANTFRLTQQLKNEVWLTRSQ